MGISKYLPKHIINITKYTEYGINLFLNGRPTGPSTPIAKITHFININ